ncbi:MAG: EAL domain-containing protein, partial [Pseudazoarcus pumilus]|nr:EAL domain-containing protein [Pseudazoarcus pumilus]
MRVLRRWQDMGLASRIVGMSLLLLLLVQLAGFAVVRSAIDDNARAQIAQELTVGERVWRRVLEQNAQQLRVGAGVLAADFGFRSALATQDAETLRSALSNHGERIGARITALLDPALQLVATSDDAAALRLEAEFAGIGKELFEALQGSEATGHMALVGGQPFEFIMVPVRAPLLIGWVLMGFPIDQALADDMRNLLSLHLVMASRVDGEHRVVVTTLPPEVSARLAGQRMSGAVELEGEEFVARRIEMLSGAEQGRVETMLLRSVREVTEPYRQLQVTLAAITALAVLLFAFGSSITARRVTQPLRELIGVTERLQRGDYDTPVRLKGVGDDEVGRLGRSFEHMRTSIERQQREIRRLAYWDRLTGLPNREQFREALTQTIAGGAPFAVLMLNLDRFKHVNDVLGYAFGDALLCAVAERLNASIDSERDQVARISGDTFAILLAESDGARAQAKAADISQAFAAPLALAGQTVDISAGIGIACWPEDGDGADLLLNRAEIAMHAAKARAAGTLRYEARLDSSSSQTLSLLTDLRHAMERDELRMYLQPKIDVASGTVVGAEALVRWRHPQRGLVPPMDFIPFAEQTGFIRHITLWVLEQAARQWQALQPAQGQFRIAVNLSTRDLLDLEFPERIAALCARHDTPTAGLCLEITESAIMDDPQRAEATLNRLAALGFKLSIDDFGTGYSSLAYLKRLPVNELKIDRSFVMAMESDESDATIVRSTIDLAHNLGLTVVAEGVENDAALAALRALRCDDAQGYHISRPLPAEDFAAWR